MERTADVVKYSCLNRTKSYSGTCIKMIQTFYVNVDTFGYYFKF